jgi:hypothetical protein
MTRVSSISSFGATLLLALAAGAVASPAAHAQSAAPAIYPAQGQSAKQQDKDKYECYAWARRQTGFDPAAASAQAAQMPPGPANLLRGAMGGAAIGELAHDDPGQGAAVGALGAAVRQRVKQQQQAAAQSQQRAGYERAFGACLQARGYTVR